MDDVDLLNGAVGPRLSWFLLLCLGCVYLLWCTYRWVRHPLEQYDRRRSGTRLQTWAELLQEDDTDR